MEEKGIKMKIKIIMKNGSEYTVDGVEVGITECFDILLREGYVALEDINLGLVPINTSEISSIEENKG